MKKFTVKPKAVTAAAEAGTEEYRDEIRNSIKYNRLCKQAREIADKLEDFLAKCSNFPKLSDYLDEYDMDHIANTLDALNDFAESDMVR